MTAVPPPRVVDTLVAEAQVRLARWRNDLWRLPWRVEILPSLQAWGISRIILAVATLAVLLLNRQQDQRTSLTLHTVIHTWNRFDTPWYLFIAHSGYVETIASVYFPLYPMLIHLGMAVFGPEHDFLIALAISNLSLLVALFGLAKYARMADLSPRLTQAVLLAYPLAFFLAAGYTESLFLACAVWAFVHARKGRWLLASLCGALAVATRVTGVILWLPLLWEFGSSFAWWYRENWTWQRIGQAAAVAWSIPAVLLAYMAYSAAHFHDALAFVHSETAWTHQFLWPWEIISVAWTQWTTVPGFTYQQARVLLDVAPWLACVALTIALVMRRDARRAEVWYMVGLLALGVASPLVQPNFPYLFVSAGRYCVVAFPLWLLLARWIARWPWLENLVVHGGFVLQAVLLSIFLRDGWIV